jgi:hypothetical protein
MNMHTTLAGIQIEIPSLTKSFGVRENAQALGKNIVTAVSEGEIPPVELLKDGRITLVPAGTLTALESIRKKAQRTLAAAGVQVGRLYAIPGGERTDSALAGLEKLREKFSDELEVVIICLDDAIQRQIDRFPQWEGIIRNYRPTPESVRRAARFQLTAFRIEAPEGVYGKKAFHEACGEIASGLVEEIVTVATELASAIEDGKKTTVDADERLLVLLEKAQAFAYLHPEVESISGRLADALSSTPTPAALRRLANPVSLVTRPENLLTLAA